MDLNKLPVVGAQSGEKPRLAIQYTLDGEVLCKKIMGGYVPMPLRTVALAPGFDLTEYTEPMARFWALIEETRRADPLRQVPIPADELVKRFQICDKKTYKKIVAKGLLKEVLIPIVDTVTGKNLGSRRVVFFTPQGRAFVRAYIEPTYAKTENQ